MKYDRWTLGLAVAAVVSAALTLGIWIPNDIESGLVETFRRQTTIGDAMAPTMLARMVAAVEEAEAAELYVAAHVYTARAANRVLRAGVRSIEHGNLIDTETFDLLRENDAFLVPTMATYQALVTEGVEAGMPADMVAKVHDVFEAGKETASRVRLRVALLLRARMIKLGVFL